MEPRKPSLDNISIEDLIKLADKEKTQSLDDKINDAELFMMDTQIKESRVSPPVEGQNIYWAYCKWCKANDKVPARRVIFFREFKKRYEVTDKWPGGIRFWIERAPFHLEGDEWWEMRRALRREPNYNKKKKKDTKK